jgi:hypothetical protein
MVIVGTLWVTGRCSPRKELSHVVVGGVIHRDEMAVWLKRRRQGDGAWQLLGAPRISEARLMLVASAINVPDITEKNSS